MALSPSEQAELDRLLAARETSISGGAVKRVKAAGREMETHAPDKGAAERRIAELTLLASGGRRRGALGFRV